MVNILDVFLEDPKYKLEYLDTIVKRNRYLIAIYTPINPERPLTPELNLKGCLARLYQEYYLVSAVKERAMRHAISQIIN